MDDLSLVGLIIVGAIAGTAAASVLGLRKTSKGQNWLLNTIVGIIGALIGPIIFNVIGVELGGVFEESISIGDVITAFVGALIVIFVAGLIRDR